MKVKQIFKIIHRSYHQLTQTSAGDVEWLFHETDTHMIIAFRGTETKGLNMVRDIIRNIFSLIPWKHKNMGWVSYGYLKGAEAAIDDIYRFLERKKGNIKKPIIVCGHSMGGAISYLCASIMHSDKLPVSSWVGTGVVNCVITKQFPKFNCMNFKYEEDIVSIFPFKIFGFKQPYKFIHIGSDDSKYKLFNIGDVNDHNMKLYVKHAPDMNVL